MPADRIVGTATPRTSVEVLFEGHYVRLVQHLSVVAGSREVAADAVQEAFVQAHLRWTRLAGYEDPVGWIRRVALNKIHNRRRSVRRRAAAVARLASTALDRVEDWAGVVNRADVGRALSELSAQQRTAVVLFYLEGLSIAQAAAEMGLSQGSVKTHLHRARHALRPLLEVR